MKEGCKLKNPYLDLDESTLIKMFVNVRTAMKTKQIIRTNNVIGDLGERQAIQFYNSHPELPNLKPLEIGTKHVDAVNIHNERYSIKATSTSRTSIFWGLNSLDCKLPQEQIFEYVIIIMLNDDLLPRAIYELNWETFLEFRIWSGFNKAWYLNVTDKLKKNAKVLYVGEILLKIIPEYTCNTITNYFLKNIWVSRIDFKR